MNNAAQANFYQSTTSTQNTVGQAWRQLGQAWLQLFRATVQSLLASRTLTPLESAQQEAEQLRHYADSLYSSDPRFAQDLYAAASRHEAVALKR